ncbi:hypothetical protein [Nocardioides sp.]|uniref:hypothetical protein n=1 Tax=Nocardioides sp. TaxID=35761 RepID=UPI003568C5B5
MISIKNSMTAQIPSAFGMPSSAHACVNGAVTPVVRTRTTVVGADLGLANGYFPWTSAWRPPSC